MNRIKTLFQKKRSILSIYFTAGYPGLKDTVPILTALQDVGVDMVEIGIPFSDPLADGPVIQKSSFQALQNGLSLELLFTQLENIRQTISIPLLFMGYLNPIYQYGIEKFCQKCQQLGIDGVILPDLPLQEYIQQYQKIFTTYKLSNIFLITPQTAAKRIRTIDQISDGFIYMVSSASTTGGCVKQSELQPAGGEQSQNSYFARIKEMKLSTPLVIGFGIHNRESFNYATNYAQGAIIGSAFIKAIEQGKDITKNAKKFVKQIKEK